MKASSSGVILNTSSHLPFEAAVGIEEGGADGWSAEASGPLDPFLLSALPSTAEAASDALELACSETL